MSSEDYNSSSNLSSDDEAPENKRTKYSKDSHVYGIFGDEEEERNTRPIRKRKVNFVTSTTEPEILNNGELSEEDERPSFSTFTENRNEALGEESTELPEHEENEYVSEHSSLENEQENTFAKPIHKLSKGFGKFGGSSSGFGLKFLKKFGYKEGQGLGSKGQGLAEPILPNIRKDYKAGIAHGGVSEMDGYTRKLEKQRFNKPDDSSDEDDKDGSASGGLNKRVKFKKPKVQFKSFKQTLDEIDQRNIKQQKVIDMTGSQPKEMDKINVSTSDIYSKEDKRLLIELGEFEKDKCEEELIELNDQLIALEIRHQTIGDEFKIASIELELVEVIESAIQECQKFQVSLSSEEMESLSIYSNHLQKLNDILNLEIPSNFYKTVQHQLSEAAVACIIPNFKRVMAQWNPLQDHLNDVSTFFSSYPNLFYTSDTLYLSASDSSLQQTLWDNDSGATPMTPFDSLIYHIWLPKVRSTIVNQWSPQNYDSAIGMFEVWRPPRLVSSYIFELVINQSIIPKMQLAVENWDPKNSTTSLKLFIHPWLPLIHAYLNPLVDTIRSKLGLTLVNWHPQDPAAFNIVEDWKPVFSDKDMLKLIDRSILPKLFEMVKFEFIIDPSNQNTAAITNVINWHTHLGDRNIEKILKDAFFPKFNDVLKDWLNIKYDLDLEDVFDWVLYWKNVFPQKILSLGIVDHSFRLALDLLNESVDKVSR
jgi:tuftelin-interacting protein 11